MHKCCISSFEPFCGGPVANLKQDLVFLSKPVAQTSGHDPGSISLFTSRYCSGSMDCCGVTEFTVTNITWIFKCRALARQQQAQYKKIQSWWTQKKQNIIPTVIVFYNGKWVSMTRTVVSYLQTVMAEVKWIWLPSVLRDRKWDLL